MPGEAGILATFSDPGAAARAIRSLREQGFVVRAAMPAPIREVVQAIGTPRSTLERATMAGALLGIVCGALLTVATSLAWPILTGGMPIVSIPPFAIVTFETMVLAASLATLVALLFRGWRGGRPRAFPENEGFQVDRIGVFASGGDGAEAERILHASGADGVRRVP
jgi:hypothetical protein